MKKKQEEKQQAPITKIINVTNIIRPVLENPVVIKNKIKQDILEDLKAMLEESNKITLSKLKALNASIIKLKQLQELSLSDIKYIKKELAKDSKNITKLQNLFHLSKQELEYKINNIPEPKNEIVEAKVDEEGIVAKVLKRIPIVREILIKEKPIIKKEIVQVPLPRYEESLSNLKSEVKAINGYVKSQDKNFKKYDKDIRRIRRQVSINAGSTLMVSMTMATISAGLFALKASFWGLKKSVAGLAAGLKLVKNQIKNGSKILKRIPIVGAVIEATDGLSKEEVRKRLKLKDDEEVTIKQRLQVAATSATAGLAGSLGDGVGFITSTIGSMTGIKTLNKVGEYIEKNIGSEAFKEVLYNKDKYIKPSPDSMQGRLREEPKQEPVIEVKKKEEPKEYVIPTKEKIENKQESQEKTEAMLLDPQINLINVNNTQDIEQMQENKTIDFVASPTHLEEAMGDFY